MKKQSSKSYLVLIPTMLVILQLMQNNMGLSDVTLGIVTGAGFGLAVLALIVAKKEMKRPESFKENIKRKLLNH